MLRLAILSMSLLASFGLAGCGGPGGDGPISGTRITRDQALPLCEEACARFLACDPNADPIGVCMDDCLLNTNRWTEDSLSAWVVCFLERTCDAYNDDEVGDRGNGGAVALVCCGGLPRSELQRQYLDACAAKRLECPGVDAWNGCGGGAALVNDEDVMRGLACFEKPCAEAEFCLRVPMQWGSVCDPVRE